MRLRLLFYSFERRVRSRLWMAVRGIDYGVSLIVEPVFSAFRIDVCIAVF